MSVTFIARLIFLSSLSVVAVSVTISVEDLSAAEVTREAEGAAAGLVPSSGRPRLRSRAA